MIDNDFLQFCRQDTDEQLRNILHKEWNRCELPRPKGRSFQTTLR